MTHAKNICNQFRKVVFVVGLALAFMASGTVSAQDTTKVDSGYPEGCCIDIIEYGPEFPGGMDSLYKFMRDSLRYPKEALEKRIEGKVYITFVVEKDGSITDPRVLRDIGGGCGEEAIRMVMTMPKWEPGKQSGVPVRVQFNLPVRFEIPKVPDEIAIPWEKE